MYDVKAKTNSIKNESKEEGKSVKNQEICRFVNSKDIRQHLLDINYEFTTAEASWLVYECRNATLQEKINAWENIISTRPDQSVNSFHFDKPYESIHKVLKDYIEMKNKMLEMFMQEVPGGFYQYKVSYSIYDNDYDDSPAYSSFDKCHRQLKTELKESEDDEILRCSIRRCEIDSFYPITACCSRTGEVTDVKVDADYGVFDWQLTDFFDNLWFHFPVPYKKGDILYDPCRSQKCLESGPVVMTGITPLAYEEDGREHSDTSDMNVWGYFQKDDGTIYSEVTWNYMDYEYYPQAELKGKKRILTVLSNYVKVEINVEMLLRAYHCVLLEEAVKDIMPKGWWTDECMQLAGIRPAEDAD